MAIDLSGRVVGNYRILDKIGEGGMGAVYRATDLMLDREVALKAIRPALAEEPESVRRFHAEAKLAARLAHPTLATIYGFFSEGEQLFLAMELVRGESLAQRLKRRGALPWPEAAQIIAAALEGIAVAHRAGIIHRDLKPDNLMVTDAGAVKVMDFGIARALEGTRLTRTGLLVGTLAYMAPEQIRGEEVDHRTDLYSMGIVLYQALTGRPPFEGGSDFAILKAQIDEAPKPPGSLVPGLPLWLERTVLKALAKDPGARFQTAEEMRQVLQAGAVVATIELQPTVLRPAVAAAAGAVARPAEPTPPPVPPPPPFTPPPVPTAVPIPPPPPAASTIPAAPPTPVPSHTTRSSDYQTVGPRLGRPLLLAAALVACAVLGGFFAWNFLRPSPRLEEQAASADPLGAVPSESFLANPAEPAAQPGKPAVATTTPPLVSSPPRDLTPIVPSVQPQQVVPKPPVESSETYPAPPAPEPPPAIEPQEEDDEGPTAEGELTGLGQNMVKQSAQLYSLYSDYLETKEDGGAELTQADEQLQSELADFEEYVEDFAGAQKPGWRSRLRGRGADPEQLRRRIAKSLAPMRASAERIDRLMATVAPSPDVRRLWQEIKQRARRAAALVGT